MILLIIVFKFIFNSVQVACGYDYGAHFCIFPINLDQKFATRIACSLNEWAKIIIYALHVKDTSFLKLNLIEESSICKLIVGVIVTPRQPAKNGRFNEAVFKALNA